MMWVTWRQHRTQAIVCLALFAAITVTAVARPAMAPLGVVLAAVPGYLGVVVGAPLLGQELERGTWQLAWSQTVPRTRWLVTQLALVVGGLVVFGAAVTAVVTWARARAEASVSAHPPLNFEGVFLTCSLLCAFALGVLAGLLLRNTIAAMVVAYIAWEVPFLVAMLLSRPQHIRFWVSQLIDGGLFLGVAAAALGTAVWLLHRRTT